MRTIFTLLRKDLIIFLRNKASVVLTFVVPIALIYVFGHVFNLNRKSQAGPVGIPIAVVNESDNPAAAKLVAALQAETAFRVMTARETKGQPPKPLIREDARAMIENRELRFALVIPADLFPKNGLGLRLQTFSDPRNDIETQTVNGLLQKTIFSNVPDLLGQSLQQRARDVVGEGTLNQFNQSLARAAATAFGGDPEVIQRSLTAGDFGLSALSARAATPGNDGEPAKRNPIADFIKIEDEQVVGKEVKSPEATRIIAGQAIMFLLFAISGASAAFFDEKNAGLFQRLLSAPVSRAHLLWSRFLFGVVIGLIQLFTLFFTGFVLYDVDIFSQFGNLFFVACAAAAASASFGMLIAAIAPNAQAASGLATFLVLMMSALGGAWFPLFLMPEIMQKIARFTLVYWTIDGFQQVLWARVGFLQLLPTVGVLLGITTIVMTFSIWRLNRRKIFG